MTAEPDLLPLPDPNGSYINPYDGVDLKAYARANVAHVTAAKDAEIEALRAEVERLTAFNDDTCESFNRLSDERTALITRAEQLAEEVEALRAEVELLKNGIVPRDDDLIVPVKLLDEINASGAEWKDRAEQLAEALSHQRWCRTCAEDGWESCEDGRKADALLRPTAAQENGDA